MPKRKLTKTVADAARAETVPYELRDTIIPGFLLKVTPTGRKIFMVAYVACVFASIVIRVSRAS